MRSALVLALVAMPHVALGDPGNDVAKRPTSEPEPAELDGLGVLGIARTQEFRVDSTFAYSDGSDAVGLAAGARLGVGASGFLEGTVPVGWQKQSNALALGDVMVGAGLLPRGQRLVGIAVRLAVPTSPQVGTGLATANALAAPRLADTELWLAHATSAEVVADWRWRGNATFLQLEGGVAGRWLVDRYETVLRLSIAGGVRITPWLDLESSFVTRSFLATRNTGEEFIHSLILGMVAHTDRGQLAVRLEVPIDDSARNDNRFLVGLELRGR